MVGEERSGVSVIHPLALFRSSSMYKFGVAGQSAGALRQRPSNGSVSIALLRATRASPRPWRILHPALLVVCIRDLPPCIQVQDSAAPPVACFSIRMLCRRIETDLRRGWMKNTQILDHGLGIVKDGYKTALHLPHWGAHRHMHWGQVFVA
ncbi:hypothetical protein B0H13DRAFT_136523 [Mycena leptocephala]|nr:hypothetical protein B0H13DRAFT_136523 [Mycena leptocephala]